MSPVRGRKEKMARICPVSLKAGSKINLTICFQGALKNGHNIQFEIPRNPIHVSQNPQIMLLLHFPKVLISKLSTYFLNSLGDLMQRHCVFVYRVYRNTCVCVGIHVYV